VDDVFDLMHSIFPCICKPEKRINPRAVYVATKSRSTLSAAAIGSEEEDNNKRCSSAADDENQSDLEAPNNHNLSKKIVTSVTMKSTTVPTRHFNDYSSQPSSSSLQQLEKQPQQPQRNSYSENFRSHRTMVPTAESFLE
jgi:hypothetical protein